MTDKNFVPRIDGNGADPVRGRVVWSPLKSMWHGSMIAITLVAAPVTIGVDSVVLFAVTTYATLLAGHSVGMHRGLIHRTYEAPKWVERTLVYIGVLVGAAGPFGVIRIHDLRDWAQRQAAAHDFFTHRRPLWLDLVWQLHCRFELDHSPRLTIEPERAEDPWYRWLERTWMLQQLPIASLLFLAGGWAWVVWGVCARVAVSNIGHWVVTYYAHRTGRGDWHVRGASVQGSNLGGLGLITMGECWHNNHHAFPESARMGLNAGQADPGWWLLCLLEHAGLVRNLGLPLDVSEKPELVPAPSRVEAAA